MSEPQEVKDIIDGLTTPTADEMYQATREYDTRHVLAAVGAKADDGGGGGGGSQLWTKLTPVDFAFNTANLVNPSDNGFEVFSIPANTAIFVWPVLLTSWIGFAGSDELIMQVALNAADTSHTCSTGQYNPNALSNAAPVGIFPTPGPDVNFLNDQLLFAPVVATVACKVFAAIYPTSTSPSAGTGRFYGLTFDLS